MLVLSLTYFIFTFASSISASRSLSVMLENANLLQHQSPLLMFPILVNNVLGSVAVNNFKVASQTLEESETSIMEDSQKAELAVT